jgi:hypothetical protein
MKAFPNYAYNSVSINELYQLEKKLFGFHFNGAIVTPNEYWRLNYSNTLDILAGFFYLSWIPVPLTFAGVLFFYNKRIEQTTLHFINKKAFLHPSLMIYFCAFITIIFKTTR